MGGSGDNPEWEDYISFDFDKPVYENPLLGSKGMKLLLVKGVQANIMETLVSPEDDIQHKEYIRRQRYFRGLMLIVSSFFSRKKQ